ncbi:PWWP domain-containing protein 2B [Anguilla anguilla]|uniref:PWWP domain-containing protein 2B n=1 Tax=Anguilla anguilla TaxID=7936 RepID=UPI0015AF44C0|nr:PWWP domain-containing protein 2B [Anguilla anguilla]
MALAAGIEQRQPGHLIQENMEAAAEELRAGSRIPVIIDQIVNDTLVVTLSYRERSYTGILLDSNKKTGLFCLPDVVTKQEESPALRPCTDVPPLQPCAEPSSQTEPRPRDENALPEKTPAFAPAPAPAPTPTPTPAPSPAPIPAPVPTPVPAGQAPYPPYFEGAPFPQPLWVRHSYGQWVPQPPPRPIKRKKRRSREPGRMTMSTIRLRPRQVLCEKCKNTLNSDEDSKDGPGGPKAAKKEDGDGKEGKRRDEPGVYDAKRCKRDKFPGEVVPHSPVIKISYSTPQGKGEVMKIPSRVHGSVKPFCPKQQAQDALGEAPQEEPTPAPDAPALCPAVSIPKLKLPRPPQPAQDIPSPKIRLKPRGAGEDSLSVYEAELVGGARRRSPRGPGPQLPGHSEDSAEKSSLEQSSGSSGEEGDRHGDLTLLINFRKRKADSSSLSVCSSDSLDESKSFSSDGTSPELCDLAPGDDLSVSSSSSSSRDAGKTVPPLTVRLHTRSMTKCVTEEGHAVAVGDVVWGKIHGFPWWPARVLSLACRKGEPRGAEAWPEATVSWFGSPTTSQLSASKLSPFRDFFRSRFNRKKKGMYRRAIVEAAKAVGHMSPEITTLLSHCET